jgi:hypothetical protein
MKYAQRLPRRQRARPRPIRPGFDSGEQPPNSARFTFLDLAAQQFFPDWERAAKDLVAALRSEAGRNPHDGALTDLVGELRPVASRSASGGPPTTSANTRPVNPDQALKSVET